MDFHDRFLWFQPLGIHGEHYNPDNIQPIGKLIRLSAGTFSNRDHPLGVVNLIPIELQEGLLDANWLLCGYEIKTQRREETFRLMLADRLPMRRVQYCCIPPGAIQPHSAVQPVFRLHKLERNPCPGWLERIHLYPNPEKPFDATAVLYTDIAGSIASVELFDICLRHSHQASHRRIWISFQY